LDEVYQQVRTVAAVHDFLSHEHLGDSVNTQPLLHRLVELASGFSALLTDVHAVAALLPVKEATSVALITNELILNAGKHGANSVSVDFCREANTYILRVTDNGPGLPSDFSVATHANIGLTLVETLAHHDLKGVAHWVNHAATGGAQVEIIFPAPQ
jgi:two-component sensor histidine kinase